ncbi:PREDICTED: uncharacterized protein LOC105368453 [Ceratosolen solmsi marchali]|uniref:Uncharacterized protein LOC105368453 n=1 Tax=Ceratosolen solmsi marchali TaxID=326594 RepID=A0AAJ7E2T2_9HYME|nr:PREDICTED: uncharacterized protein LOC105368453 [Ceratosolen solmsi marchali]
MSKILVHGIGRTSPIQPLGTITFTIQSLRSKESIIVHAHILKSLSILLPPHVHPQCTWPHIEGLPLADKNYAKARPADIVLGADSYGQVMKHNIIKSSPHLPIAQLSIFGWVVIGPAGNYTHTATSMTITTEELENSLQNLLLRFWIIEEIPWEPSGQLNPDQQQCEQYYIANQSRVSTGRYKVKLPFTESPETLGDSYIVAHQCLVRLQKRFTRDNNYRTLYVQFMTEYENMNHMRRLPAN